MNNLPLANLGNFWYGLWRWVWLDGPFSSCTWVTHRQNPYEFHPPNIQHLPETMGWVGDDTTYTIWLFNIAMEHPW